MLLCVYRFDEMHLLAVVVASCPLSSVPLIGALLLLMLAGRAVLRDENSNSSSNNDSNTSNNSNIVEVIKIIMIIIIIVVAPPAHARRSRGASPSRHAAPPSTPGGNCFNSCLKKTY